MIVKIIFWYKDQRFSSINWTPFNEYQTYQVGFFSIKLGETVRLCQNVEWDFAFACNISIQLVSLKTRPGPVCNFQSIKVHVELIVFYRNFFCYVT